MSDPTERSESGAPIVRHQARDRGFEPAHGDRETLEAVSAHVEKYVGKVESVFHELVSDLVHVDVHSVAPTPERNYATLVTSGMSDRPMTAPEGLEAYRHAELVICLPPDWPLTGTAFRDESNYWPVRWLKLLARLPHEYRTWLFASHTVPNGDPAEPFAANTGFCGVILANPVLFDEGFGELAVNDGKTVHFLSVIPLYREEMEFKLREGSDALYERFGEAGVTELLDLERPNVCADE